MKIGSKASDQYFPLCLHETFFKSQLLLTLHNTFDNPVARYGGVIDYLVITGKSRVARRDVEFLKIVPIANIWLSTKEGQLRYSHDLLFVNTCFNVDVDFEVRNKTLQPLASQTYVKHSKPEAEKLKILLGKKKLNFEYGTLTLGDDVNNIECSIAIIVSDTPKMYKNVLTASLGQEITTPEIRVSR